MQNLLLDIHDKNKEKIWISFLALFNIKVFTTNNQNLLNYDIILSDNSKYLDEKFNFLILESDIYSELDNVKTFDKYTSQDEIYNQLDELTGEWFLLDQDCIDLNLDIPYYLDIAGKKIKIDIDNHKDNSKIYTPVKYTSLIKESIFSKLIKTNDKIKALSVGTEAFIEKIQNVGFSVESLLLADKIISNALDNFNNIFFKEVVNDLLSNKSYLAEFVLKAYIGTSIAKLSGYKEEDIGSLVKSFFLADSINPKDKNHPINISNQIIEDRLTSQIILQHHERPEGKGFPSQLQSYQLEELSKIYIISECFYILLKKYNFDKSYKKKIVYTLEEKFSDKYFSNYIHALKYLFYKKQK